MTYNKITLAFNGDWAHLEPLFLHDHFHSFLPRMRTAIVILLLFYGCFGVLDGILVPHQKHAFWLIRYAMVIPLALGALFFSFFNGFEKYAQICLFVLCLVGGGGIVSMVFMAGPPAHFSYYAGIILVFITIHAFLPLYFIRGCLCSSVLVAGYGVLTLWAGNLPWSIFLNILAAVILCMICGYEREIATRRMFFSSHLLALEKQKMDQINAELDQRVRERTRALHKKKKMEAIGTLAGGIAHDFNNILSAILGYAELALLEIDPKSLAAEGLRQVMAAGRRATDLTHQILTFSRQTEQEVSPMAIKPVVLEALELIRASTPSLIQIRQRLESDAWIKGDPTQVHRIVINLCTNAVHAMKEKPGVIDILLAETWVEAASYHGMIEKEVPAPGKYVVLSVTDSGHGMTPEVMDQVFDPFFSTKTGDHGIGMGLSVVHGIVKQYGGSINVESTPGEGSIFSLFLPVCDAPAPPMEIPDNKPLEGDEFVVVVDDEPAITDLLDLNLSSKGYRVKQFSDAVETVRFIKEDPRRIDLVITDFNMPQMTGMALSKKLYAIDPSIPVILCTGYSEKLSELNESPYGIRAFLMKPIDRSRLFSTVRSVLDETKCSQNPACEAD